MSKAETFSSFSDYQKYRKTKQNKNFLNSSDSDEGKRNAKKKNEIEKEKGSENYIKHENMKILLDSSDFEIYQFPKKLNLSEVLIFFDNAWQKEDK